MSWKTLDMQEIRPGGKVGICYEIYREIRIWPIKMREWSKNVAKEKLEDFEIFTVCNEDAIHSSLLYKNLHGMPVETNIAAYKWFKLCRLLKRSNG